MMGRLWGWLEPVFIVHGVVIFTVYENPRDYPGQFVVRRWREMAGAFKADPVLLYVGPSLDDARAALPAGLHCVGRKPGDDMAILESWM